jgi:rare lipoprotein A
MKMNVLLFLGVFLCFSACARDVRYVKKADKPVRKLITLGETTDRGPLKPYTLDGKRYYVLPKAHGFVQFGKASWYGKKFHGRPTSSGEVFDMYEISAAHKTLPLQTVVKVRNLSNQKELIVRINDRGPFVKGRIIDLSFAAAKRIDLIGPGVTQVEIEALGREVERLKGNGKYKPVVEVMDFNGGAFTVQVGAFKEKRNALALAKRLRVLFEYVDVSVVTSAGRMPLYRVRVSKSKTLPQAAQVEKKLENMGFEGAFVVSL